MGYIIKLMDTKTEEIGHLADLPRLNRISGQVAGVKKMIEEHRHCPDILTQLRAIRSAVKGLEASILERHLAHCVAQAITSGDEENAAKKIEELKEIFKRYDV